jgi:hypothetical protein
MKSALVVFFSLATLAFAVDSQPIQVKRVASVTWDPKTAKLIWVVQNGLEGEGGFVPSSEERYEISPNDAVMAFQGEKRGFTDVDATRLLNLLHVLTGYCIQSTVWWYEGQSAPHDDGKPTAPPAGPATPEPTSGPGMTPQKVFGLHINQAPGMIQPVVREMAH